jgi:hypothetical protein
MYRGKSETRAKELHRELEFGAELATPERTTAVLTEALALAPSLSELFFEILVLRARTWYRLGHLTRCTKDCQYFGAAISRVQDEAFAEESRVDVLLLQADCSKALGALDRANGHLNEAMRRISELAIKRSGCEAAHAESFKAKKHELFKYFLQRKQQLRPDAARLLDGQTTSPRVRHTSFSSSSSSSSSH